MSIAFLLTALVIVLTPGTGALLTISAGLSRGARASVVTALGCTLGIVPHLLAAVTGTAALLRASGVAFAVLKGAGVIYLLVMAVRTWRDRSPIVVNEEVAPRSAMRTIASAMVANVLNPKLTIFFFAFLPQFVPAAQNKQIPAMIALSAVFMALTLVVLPFTVSSPPPSVDTSSPDPRSCGGCDRRLRSPSQAWASNWRPPPAESVAT